MVDATGAIVLTGYTGVNNTPNKDLVVAKLDSSGNFLADIRIRDSGALGYGLYGFDLEQANSGEYIVVGTGVDSPTLPGDKYAFVLKVDQALSTIAWSRIYRSNLTSCLSCPTNFDSFNHILKVNTSPLTPTGEVYLLTGSGADNLTNKQMVVNDLIDPGTGNSVWAQTIGYNNIGEVGYPFKGTMALQRGTGAGIEFYVMHPALRTHPLVTIVDGTGSFPLPPTPSSISLLGLTPNFIVNGMVWEDPATQNNIIFSGYRTSYPAGAPWESMLFSVDITGPTFQWARTYTPSFDYNAFQSINFDYIVQPIHHITVGIGNLDNQFFYQPKALVRGTTGYRFCEPRQSGGGSPFSLGFHNTDAAGNVNPACTNSGSFDSNETDLDSYLNFNSSSYSFNVLSSGPSVVNANPVNTITCN